MFFFFCFAFFRYRRSAPGELRSPALVLIRRTKRSESSVLAIRLYILYYIIYFNYFFFALILFSTSCSSNWSQKMWSGWLLRRENLIFFSKQSATFIDSLRQVFFYLRFWQNNFLQKLLWKNFPRRSKFLQKLLRKICPKTEKRSKFLQKLLRKICPKTEKKSQIL